ncbi:hypothetical protein H0X32_01865 [Patescibacteria group bacterium]|nr:hypothetical protein [Patescibacteria group bacterium]
MGNQALQTQTTESLPTVLPWKFVIHQYPDTDAWACLWAALRFVSKDAVSEIMFVPSGERLDPEYTDGYRVLYMDTGGGDCDQHGKMLERASSFQLMAEKYGFARDPGIVDILELTRATDNVERISRTDIHYYFKGLPYHLTDCKSREVDWEAAADRVFEVLNVIYSQGKMRARAKKLFQYDGRIQHLKNGLQLAIILQKPNLREEAFERGADVVVWTQKHDDGKFYVGIQVNRRTNLYLGDVMHAIRMAEAEKRAAVITGSEARELHTIPSIPGWFFHDSGKLIVCGSRSHDLEPHEFTLLEPHEILTAVRTGLGRWIRPS